MIVELDGMLWKPRPETTVTGEEFIRARSLVQDIHRMLQWNPWVIEDRLEEYDTALKLMSQWTRAEPEFLLKTAEELEAELKQRLAADDARVEAELAQAEKDRAERVARYDPGRAEARLSLLEEKGVLASKISERDQLKSGELFPAMDDTRRQALLAQLDAVVAATASAVDKLSPVVGDAEAVPDENGWLPRERRDLALTIFAAQRVTEVRELRSRVSAHQAELTTAKGRPERARIREALRKDTARLAFLEAMPPVEAPTCARNARPSQPGIP